MVKIFISFTIITNLFFLNFHPFGIIDIKTTFAQEETSSTEFLYTAGGQRIAKIEGDGVHTYYLPGVEVIIDENGGITYRRYYAFNGSVAVRDNNGISFTHSDQLGSTAITTDANGDLIGSASYYPFGATRTSEGTIVGERKYTGQVSDEDTTGLYYYNARYYSPTIGRFTQADTASDGQNKYAYVGNNPVNANDPTGHKAGDPIMHDYDGGWTPPARYPNGRRDRGRVSESGGTAQPSIFNTEIPDYLTQMESPTSYEDISNYYSSTDYFWGIQDQVGAIAIPLALLGGVILAWPVIAPIMSTPEVATAVEMVDTTIDAISCANGDINSCALISNPIPRPLSLNIGSEFEMIPGAIRLDINPATIPDVVADASHLPFPREIFNNIYQHDFPIDTFINNRENIQTEMLRVLRGGGRIEVRSFNRQLYFPTANGSDIPINPFIGYYNILDTHLQSGIVRSVYMEDPFSIGVNASYLTVIWGP